MSDAVDRQGPFEEQREIYDLLSQETRHLVLQYVLAHPEHLLSLDEFAYLIPKNKAAIRDQLQHLRDAGILKRYDYKPNEESRDLPSQFYGLTEYGVEILEEYNYLRGLPVARALYDSTRLSEKAERHRDAPRPELPEPVKRRLQVADETTDDFDRVADYIRERNARTASVEEQVQVAKALYRNDVTPDHGGVTVREMSDDWDLSLTYVIRTVLDHLVETGLVEQIEPPGPDVFLISERRDEIVNGRAKAEAQENLDALLQQLNDELQVVDVDRETAESLGNSPEAAEAVALADGRGRTIRAILAEEFDVRPDAVAEYLTSGNPVDRLNAAVDAIESSEEVRKSEEYGRILFRRRAHRYRLTDTALELL